MPRSETKSETHDWFERVWTHREEVLYRSLFGAVSRGIFTIPPKMITGLFKQETFDPRWLHYGVFEFAPTTQRNSWLYVTSGMSNEWEAESPDPNSVSGLGCEFIFETTVQSEWAILRTLHLLTFQILLCHGRYPGKEPLTDFDRIPLREPIRGQSSSLTWLMLAPPSDIDRVAKLDSGIFDFYQVVGITEGEAQYARSHDGQALIELLTAQKCFPVTDPDRNEIPLNSH